MKWIFTLLLTTISFSYFTNAQCGGDPVSGLTTVGTPLQILNSYYPGLGNPAMGNTSLDVGALDTRGSATAITNGDLVLIIQMQGADLNTANSDTYGDGVAGVPATGYLSANLAAGLYEYNTVTSVVGSTINFAYGLANNYYTRSYAGGGIQTYQVIRIPRYYDLEISAGGSVTAPSWNGATGGVVGVDVAHLLTINGSVDVSAKGFRGGGGINLTGATAGNTNGSGTLTNTDYRWSSPATVAANLTGGAKGEGIAGTPKYILQPGGTTITLFAEEGYLNGSMGRGAPGNAGGGATDGAPVGATVQNQYNTGGGGGGNAGAGGQGGSGWHGNTGDVNSYPTGGFGGAAFSERSIDRWVMGGGGGAGSANNSTAANQYMSSGGTGGGIIILRSSLYAGTGILNANGGNAVGITPGTNTDAAGGGGAGGTIVAVTRANVPVGLNGVTATAAGGAGGNMEAYFDHGPGGGGGGGYIITNGVFAATDVAGGSNGLTHAGSAAGPLTNSYGSFPGSAGEVVSLGFAPELVNLNNASSPCGTLPVTITTFIASASDNEVTLKWKIDNAVDFSNFIVEYSENGSNFREIQDLRYVNSQSDYSYLHTPVSATRNYYRLKLIDLNGTFTYSNILLVRMDGFVTGMTLYPVPATGHFTVNISVKEGQRTNLQLFNASGTKVREIRAELRKGDNSIQFNNLEPLPAGIYLLRATVNGTNINRKVILKK